jgi:hypothetical protein
MSEHTAEPAMVVFLATTDGGTIRAIPQFSVRSDLQHLAKSLQGELVFETWRHALAFCDVAGFAVENRNTAELLANEEELPGMNGPCWICGRGPNRPES